MDMNFIAVSFITANMYKQPRCFSIGEQINCLLMKMKDIKAKKNPKKTWKNFKCIVAKWKNNSVRLHCT